MSRSGEAHEKRPDRVIILDADDPLVEIQGQVVWQEEHDRVVEEIRQAAFSEGYEAGVRSTSNQQAQPPVHVEFRRRRTFLGRMWHVVLVAGLLIFLLMLILVLQPG